VVEAAASPLAIGLFGVGTAVAILAGVPIIGAAAIGLGAWGVRVIAAAVPGRSASTGSTKVEPFTLSDPWRQYVINAQVAKKRFDSVVNGMSAGPTQDRLDAMDDRLGDGINESWKIARRGHEISQALRVMNTADAERELAQLTSRLSPGDAPTDAEASLLEALQSQVDAADRLRATEQSAHDRLRVLDARFDELVARAIEVSIGAGDSELLGNDVDGLVTELEALRMAIDETAAAAGHRSQPPPPLPRPSPGNA
jgi:hypothetical protein